MRGIGSNGVPAVGGAGAQPCLIVDGRAEHATNVGRQGHRADFGAVAVVLRAAGRRLLTICGNRLATHGGRRVDVHPLFHRLGRKRGVEPVLHGLAVEVLAVMDQAHRIAERADDAARTALDPDAWPELGDIVRRVAATGATVHVVTDRTVHTGTHGGGAHPALRLRTGPGHARANQRLARDEYGRSQDGMSLAVSARLSAVHRHGAQRARGSATGTASARGPSAGATPAGLAPWP